MMKSIRVAMMTAVALNVALAGALTGCGGRHLEDESRQRQNENAAKLQALYERIKGTYEGQLSFRGTAASASDEALQPLRVQISLYVQQRDPSFDSEGVPVIMPALKARWRLPDVIGDGDDMILDGQYDEFSGRLILVGSRETVNPGAGDGAPGTPASSLRISITGTLLNGRIQASATRDAGPWGQLEASKTSDQPALSADGSSAEERERILSVYRGLTGTYEGQLERPNNRTAIPIQLSLSVVESASRPGLVARYRRLNEQDGVGDRFLNVSYNPQTREIFMRDSGVVLPDSPSQGLLSARGTFSQADGKLALVFSDNRTGVIGSLLATRISDGPAPGTETDERERLLEIFEKIRGVYEGEMRDANGQSFKPRLTIFKVEESVRRQDGTRYSRVRLRARFQWIPGSAAVTDRLMDVNYSEQTREIFMEGTTPIPSSTVPGAGYMSASGRIENKTLDVEITDHRGPQGRFRARWLRTGP